MTRANPTSLSSSGLLLAAVTTLGTVVVEAQEVIQPPAGKIQVVPHGDHLHMVQADAHAGHRHPSGLLALLTFFGIISIMLGSQMAL
jgi:hypothetical protein